ncbi:hypothetical protein AQUCO_04900155v1 [Aquilegia coerulea]|uniref:RING-type domain-containing protein n=1 Tax=Aquilegia coerulea TaxID=218851 RepID=A0A2G5CLD3_AQUCA|nr:hypothetical protein AQUCO_04900155v1 [Aquilegia coerulea]
MAGMLPGVELARRRRTNHHHHHHHHQFEFTSNSREPTTLHHHQRLEPSSSMDETALMARKRLEEKLRGFSSAPSRWSKQQSLKGDKSYTVAYVKETHASKRQGKQIVQLDRRNSQREVCSICLEDFQAQQQVMNLPCCHRYHSDCLLPWLSAHSHCPYCRTKVMSSAN